MSAFLIISLAVCHCCHSTPDYEEKSVFGMTLDGFVGLPQNTLPQIGHLFVDEAAYASIAKFIPLLSLRCPVTLLGDHYQLPPVCEAENNPTAESFWAKPAVFFDTAMHLNNNEGEFPYHELNKAAEPEFIEMQMAYLPNSHRFGEETAHLLSNHIYIDKPLNGIATHGMEIQCVNCEPDLKQNNDGRWNQIERDEIVRRLGDHPEGRSLAILTPYKHQIRKIKQLVSQSDLPLDEIDILNTHQAQGREWDVVWFSVVDTGNLPLNFPFFTNSNQPIGKAVLNTTISRARMELVVFLDRGWWSMNDHGLITELAQQ